MSGEKCLADKLYNEGYHFYGPFFDRRELAKGLTEAALDLASNRIDDIKLLTLEEVLGVEYIGKLERSGFKYPLENVQVLFGKVNPNYVPFKEEPRIQLCALNLSSGQIATLRGAVFKKA